MFWNRNRNIESREYRTLSLALVDANREISDLKLSFSRLEAMFKSLQGRFYQKRQDYDEEEPKAKDSYMLNPFKP